MHLSHDNLTIIAANSRYTQPVAIMCFNLVLDGDTILYFTQRRRMNFSNLESHSSGSNWKIAIPSKTLPFMRSYSTKRRIPQIRQYRAPPHREAIDIPYSLQGWLEYELKPLENNDFPTGDKVPRQIFLTPSQIIRNGGYFWTVKITRGLTRTSAER